MTGKRAVIVEHRAFARRFLILPQAAAVRSAKL